ncbi:MAG TPA: acetoin utilization protein AcuC [Actinomycetota bacterium]|nr:acetoin utilization protein AcuC [Actinomycetota bacterium]
MTGRAALVVCREARIYDHGPGHPLRPERVQLTWDLIEAYGLHEVPGVSVVPCRSAADEEIALVHDAAFIDATRRAGHGEDGPWGRYGYGPGDNPIFDRMHEAAALVVGASLVAAEEVLEGRADHAFNAAGGLHHAMPARASGFCVYDDPAVAVAWLLSRGVERVAYVDIDVHHGDGPQTIFYADPRVLTVSLHESGAYLFPGTGFVEEMGEGEAAGTKVNVPLPPGTSDQGWLRAFHEVVPEVIAAFRPRVLVTQLGCDTHATDPLAHLRLSTRAYREAARALHRLAHEAAGGRWVATGGGGYQWARVVPRAWTIHFAEMAGADVPDELPEGWREDAERLIRGPVPDRLSEPGTRGGAGDEEVAGLVAEVRRRCFPPLGLPL